jgi:hypothetical protein
MRLVRSEWIGPAKPFVDRRRRIVTGPAKREAIMVSFACRVVTAIVLFVGPVSPSGALYPGEGREIAENVIYRFGQHMFVEADVAPSSSSDMLPLADIVHPPPVCAAGLVGSGYTEGEDDEDLLNDASK